MATLNVADLNRQGKVFYAANVAATTFSVVGTAMTGLAIHNPPTSGVKVVLIDCGFAATTVTGAQTSLLHAVSAQGQTAVSGITAAATVAQAADGSGKLASALAYAAATVLAPTARRIAFSMQWASAAAFNSAVMQDRIDGSLVLVPGTIVHLAALTTAATGVASYTWAEIPV